MLLIETAWVLTETTVIMLPQLKFFLFLSIVVLSKHNVISLDYDRGEDAHLACNAKEQPIKRIVWYYDFGGSNQEEVTSWYDEQEPTERGQFKDRTELDTSTGDIIIKTLKLSDDGSYTCRYHNAAISIPGMQGDTHEINIVGNHIYIIFPTVRPALCILYYDLHRQFQLYYMLNGFGFMQYACTFLQR